MSRPVAIDSPVNLPAVTDSKPHPVVELFTSAKAREYIEPFLPVGTDIQRVAASVLLAIKNDKTGMLAKCTPQSLILGVSRIQQWGLELGVTAYLLPFKDKESGTVIATPTAGYQGLAELMIGSGAVRYVEAKAVYQGDTFAYRLGLNPQLDHVPCERGKRGPITHAYCIVHLPFNRLVFEVMEAGDIDAIRQQYSKQWKNGPLPAWYAKKTVVRQAAKLAPKNPRLAKALAIMTEDQTIEIDPTPDAPKVEALRAPADDDDDVPTYSGEREPGDEESDEFTPPY